jgi:surface protein
LKNLPNNFYKVKEYHELLQIISKSIKLLGNNCNLNWLDISEITDLSVVFEHFSNFNGDISKWNTSNVTNMEALFSNTIFNGDISNWDVSNVKNMDDMFYKSKFMGDISHWDVSNVTSM